MALLGRMFPFLIGKVLTIGDNMRIVNLTQFPFLIGKVLTKRFALV